METFLRNHWKPSAEYAIRRKLKLESKPMGTYLRGKTYWMSYMLNGEQKRESCQTSNKRVADERYASRITAIKEGRFFDIRKQEKITFEEFAEKYINDHSKVNNKSWYEDVLKLKDITAEFGSKDLSEITVKDIVKFKANQLQKIKGTSKRAKEQGKTLSPATVNRKLALLKSMFNKAIEWEFLCGENPVKKIEFLKENNRRTRYLSKSELGRLYQECGNFHPELLNFVKMAVNTGMRLGEIRGLTWSDVDVENKLIYVRRSDRNSPSPKSSRNRVLPMNESVRSVLLSIKRQQFSDFIFKSDHQKGFVAAVKRAKISNFKFHDLRHTFASYLIMSGEALNTIRELLGHSTMNMVLRYAHLSPDYKQNSVEKLSTILSQLPSEDPSAKFISDVSVDKFLSSVTRGVTQAAKGDRL